MRKVIITLSIVAMATVSSVGLTWHSPVSATENNATTQQQRQQQLKEWQMKVEDWNKQHPDKKQPVPTSMPTTMPNAGAGNTLFIAAAVFASTVAGYYLVMRKRLNDVAV